MLGRASVLACVVHAVALFLSASAAVAAGNDPTPPLASLESGAATVEMTLAGDGPPKDRIHVISTGVFVKPASLECATSASNGGGSPIRDRGVYVDGTMWIGTKSRTKPGAVATGIAVKQVESKSYPLWESCAVAPPFWSRFQPRVPDGLVGTADTTGGFATTRYVVPQANLEPSMLLVDPPKGVVITQLTVWRADDSGLVTGFEASLDAAHRSACQKLNWFGALLRAGGPCTVEVSMHFDRVNDPTLRVDRPTS